MPLDIQVAISAFFHWAIVPLVMLSVFFFGTSITVRTSNPERRVSAIAGLWAGLVIFVIFVLSQLRYIRNPTFDPLGFPALDPVTIGSGLVAGFLFLWLVRIVVPTVLVGVIVLSLTAASTVALYGYVFIESLRSVFLYLALGAVLGALLHIVVLPNSIREIWSKD